MLKLFRNHPPEDGLLPGFISSRPKVLFLSALLLLDACGQSILSQPPKEESTFRFIHHSIRPRESLELLARWYTGNGQLWRQFYLKAPTTSTRKIHVNDDILIPYELATTQTPPTEEFIANFVTLTPSRRSKASIVEKTATSEGQSSPDGRVDEKVAVSSHDDSKEVDPKDIDSSQPEDLERDFMEQIIRMPTTDRKVPHP